MLIHCDCMLIREGMWAQRQSCTQEDDVKTQGEGSHVTGWITHQPRDAKHVG